MVQFTKASLCPGPTQTTKKEGLDNLASMPQHCPTASLRLPTVLALLLQVGMGDETKVFITHIPKTGGASLILDLARYRDRNCPRAIRQRAPKWTHHAPPIPEKCHAFEFISIEAYVVYNQQKFRPFPASCIFVSVIKN